MAAMAGHDIDYIAIGGALWSLGRADSAPVPPLNLVGDFGGGGMLLAFGMVAALLEAARSGEGQVVDAAMVDGAASLMTMIHAFRPRGIWNERAWREHARHRRAVLRGLRDVGRAVDGGRAASSRSSTPRCLRDWGWRTTPSLPHQMSREDWPGDEAALCPRLQDQDAGRVDGGLRRDRCLRRARAVAVGGAPAPPQRRPVDLHRGRRGGAAGAGAAVLADAVGRVEGPVTARAPTPWRAWSNGAWTRRRSPNCASRGRSS